LLPVLLTLRLPHFLALLALLLVALEGTALATVPVATALTTVPAAAALTAIPAAFVAAPLSSLAHACSFRSISEFATVFAT